MKNVIGGWEIAPMEACKLPQDVATGFSMAIHELVGAEFIPALYCGKQTVHGFNHMLICKQVLVTEGATERLVKMILHQDLDQDGMVGNFSILYIEPIV